MNCYDTVVIGAGMSGLAAAIRAAHFGQKVCVLEKHYLWGGLNSFYKKDGHKFDVGLHALTNFHSLKRARRGPLSRVARQLRLDLAELELQEQHISLIRFPDVQLKFSNDLELLKSEVANYFPNEIDGFNRLCHEVDQYEKRGRIITESARKILAQFLKSPLLIDLISCPVFYYGSPSENDLEWHQYTLIFQAVYLEGLCRPRGGIRNMLKHIMTRLKSTGAELRLKQGVESLLSNGDKVKVCLQSGETLIADRVISSAGLVETEKMLGNCIEETQNRLTFVESIFLLDKPTQEWEIPYSTLFYSHEQKLAYRSPHSPLYAEGGIICCPGNFGSGPSEETPCIRMTHLANPHYWRKLKQSDPQAYDNAKREAAQLQLKSALKILPNFTESITYTDTFTPTTIEHFTSHIDGAVYGSAQKHHDGRTSHPKVFICGTDQGYLGVTGSLVSGILMANQHALGDTHGV